MNFKIFIESLELANQLAKKVSDRLQCNKGGSCTFFAEWATKVFLKNGITNFLVVEGWVKGDEPFWRQHTWIEMEGQKIDPTLVQFGNVKYVNKVKKKYTPEEYLNLSKKYPDEWKQLPRYLKNKL